MNVLQFIWAEWEKGGLVMVPLTLVSILIYSVAVNLLFRLSRNRFRHLQDETLTKWVAVPDQGEGEVGQIIQYTQEGVTELKQIYSKFSEVFAARLPFYERGLVFLNTLVVIAPLLGLLGTVMGMLMTFKGLSVGGGRLVDVVASGISEALITTEMGLLIAVPGYFMAYAIKRRKDEYEAFLVRLESLTLQQFKRKGIV